VAGPGTWPWETAKVIFHEARFTAPWPSFRVARHPPRIRAPLPEAIYESALLVQQDLCMFIAHPYRHIREDGSTFSDSPSA
jgi:hypothetical protein